MLVSRPEIASGLLCAAAAGVDAIAAACAPPAVFTAVNKVSYHYCFYNTIVPYLLLAFLLLLRLLP